MSPWYVSADSCLRLANRTRSYVLSTAPLKSSLEPSFLTQNEMTPVHMLLLSFAGCAFALVLGSFLCYHIYLVLCVFFPPAFALEN